MTIATLEHFRRAVADLAAHGDNDVLPFDVDTRFISACSEELALLASEFDAHLAAKAAKDSDATLKTITVFSERLLAPAGPSGFRITTKIHPFWNIYLNGLAAAIAERHESSRSSRVHSYRYAQSGPSLFQKEASWRSFKEATIADLSSRDSHQVVVLTDVSSFYEHVSHHRLANLLAGLLPGTNHPQQLEIILGKLADGRSFGLPVGGQCSRVLAEVLMAYVDRRLDAERIIWRRYVDDFVLVANSKHDAYRALGILAHTLSDLGLSLNRTKTTVLSARHYAEFVDAELGTQGDDARQLKEINLHFDPYSDTPDEDYESLRVAVDRIDVSRLLGLELDKAQPDAFVVTQITRTLGLMAPERAFGIAATLLDAKNLHSFRARWASVMRGVTFIRASKQYAAIHDPLDALLDLIPTHSPHLVFVDTNVLHYLRAIRFIRTPPRASFVLSRFNATSSITVRRACIDCWRSWHDQDMFLFVRNKWNVLSAEEQRMVWLAAPTFGDQGVAFRRQVERSLRDLWRLGIERNSTAKFAELYIQWCESGSAETAAT